jgi:G3E family GTPase
MLQAYILTGFLGAGKTTMLKNMIKEYFKDKKVAIIVNEFGSIGIDGDILSNIHSQVLEISQGCICCQLTDQFTKGIKEIEQKYNPEVIFIEASGASEPFPIFLSLRSMQVLVEGIICVIDAKNFHQYQNNTIAKQQIGGSNIIVINKIDLVNQEQLALVQQELTKIKNDNDIINEISGGRFSKILL